MNTLRKLAHDAVDHQGVRLSTDELDGYQAPTHQPGGPPRIELRTGTRPSRGKDGGSPSRLYDGIRLDTERRVPRLGGMHGGLSGRDAAKLERGAWCRTHAERGAGRVGNLACRVTELPEGSIATRVSALRARGDLDPRFVSPRDGLTFEAAG